MPIGSLLHNLYEIGCQSPFEGCAALALLLVEILMLCYHSTENDPCVNLALESALFAHPSPDPILLLYRCLPAVIIGRNQNPWNEIRFSYTDTHKIPFFRRESGGGTVYHDLGNINFSFILPRPLYSTEKNLTIVVRVLHRLGVKARYTERNDILVSGKKISGSAFRYKDNRVLHHGTLLCRANLHRLRSSLGKEQTLGINGVMVRSNPSSVTNIAEHTKVSIRRLIALFCQELMSEQYFPLADEKKKEVRFIPLSPPLLTREQRLFFDTSYHTLASWQWRVAKTPPCSLSITNADCSLQFQVKEGKITDITLNSRHPQHQKVIALCESHLSNADINIQLLPIIKSIQYGLQSILGHKSRIYKNFNFILKKLSEMCRT